MTAFTDSINHGLDAIRQLTAISVVYRRGDGWVRVCAVPGRSIIEATDGYGVSVKHRTRDYIFEASELMINGSLVEPQRGDVVEESVGNKTYEYEVTRPDGGDEVYRYGDHGRTTVRVHAKLRDIK